MSPTRREFVAGSAAALASRSMLIAPAITPAARPGSFREHGDPARTVLLFQGDSITDCSRDRSVTGANDARALGTGYPLLLAGTLRDRYPKRDLQVFNRGVSGNTVTDLEARWSADTLALRPDVLSILIGVNDIWHTLMGQYGGTPEKYETGYHALLDATRTALPSLKLIVMEPFVLRTGAVTNAWFPEFNQFRAAARRVATATQATFVPLHDMFQQLAKSAPPSYWLVDGVHPTVAGHAAIARQWMATVKL